MCETIKLSCPEVLTDAQFYMNKVPKKYHHHDVYCNLVFNDDEQDPNFKILPRLGAFEVTTVRKGTAILLYSKLRSNCWPDFNLFARKMQKFTSRESENLDGITLRLKFEATGIKKEDEFVKRSGLSSR